MRLISVLLISLMSSCIFSANDAPKELQDDLAYVMNKYRWGWTGMPRLNWVDIPKTYNAALMTYTDRVGGTLNHLLVDYDWFLKNSLDERRFVLAHELGHYRQKPIGDLTCILNLASIGCAGLPILHRLIDPSKNRVALGLKRGPLGLACALGSGSMFLMNRYIQRKLELDADKKAALALGSIKGGVDFFKLGVEYEKAHKKEGLAKVVDDLISTHPESQERVDALERLAEKHNLGK